MGLCNGESNAQTKKCSHFGSSHFVGTTGVQVFERSFILAMASSEQKLISCVGFARRMAKRLHLLEVGVHLDHALVLLAGVELRSILESRWK